MTSSDAAPPQKCSFCGAVGHPGVCPTVKAFEYYPDGSVKRVEFKTAKDYDALVTPLATNIQFEKKYG